MHKHVCPADREREILINIDLGYNSRGPNTNIKGHPTCRTVASTGQISAQQWNLVLIVNPVLGIVYPTANSI